MKIRISTLTGDTLYMIDVMALLYASPASQMARVPRPGTVLCVEAIAGAGACVRAADMRDGAGSLKFATLETVPAFDPDATAP